MNLPMRIMLATSNVGVAYADLERVEELVHGSDVDWQAVRPTNALERRRRRSGEAHRELRRARLESRARDVAAFMLSELEARSYSTRTPMITSGVTTRVASVKRIGPGRPCLFYNVK